MLDTIDQELYSLEQFIGGEVASGGEMMLRESEEHTYRDLERMEEKFKGSAGAGAFVPRQAIALAIDPNNFLMNQYRETMTAYNQDLRTRIQRRMGEALIARETAHEIRQDISGTMNTELWRVSRIVRTELHNIYSKGKLLKMRQVKDEHMPGLMKGLIHPIDHRTAEDSLVLATINPIVDLNEPFRYSYKGKVREFMTPPDRPNDRAVLVPIRNQHLA